MQVKILYAIGLIGAALILLGVALGGFTLYKTLLYEGNGTEPYYEIVIPPLLPTFAIILGAAFMIYALINVSESQSHESHVAVVSEEIKEAS